MPLVRIDHSDARSNPREIADAVHRAIVDTYGIPERDRFQVLAARPAEAIIAQDAGLGFDRQDPVIVQIFTQRGRDVAQKQALYAEIAAALEPVGVAGSDVFIGYVENGPEDWSFGFGTAQYVTGELGVPRTD